MYAKIFDSMYEGTLYGHWQAIVTLQQMLVLCDANGVIDMTPQAISARTSIPLEIITKGIEILSAPDPYSRTPGEDGKRIATIDEHRPWGWYIVNHGKYQKLKTVDDKRTADRERMAAKRSGNEKPREGFVYFASTEDGPIKIGFSANPWARLTELQTGSPTKHELLCVIPGSDATERSFHAEFVELRLEGEWFRRDIRLINRINGLQKENKLRRTTSQNVAEVAHADADADADVNLNTSSKPPVSPCPHLEIISAYHEALPTGRRINAKLWNGTRAKHLQARWREDPERQSLAWWEKFFAYCGESKFLTGRAPPQQNRPPFEISLDWIVNATNFAKIHEGTYHR